MNHVTGAVRLFFVALYILLVVFFVLAVFPFCSAVQRGRWIHRLAGWVPAICGVRMTVKGRVPDQGACETGIHSGGTGDMVCANHVSFLDIFVLDAVLPSRFVAKKEIASWPVFGMISRGVGTLFIDRSRRRAVLEVAELMSSTMKKGENVLFFPEGTTGKGDVLLPFYANLFTAGPRAEAEILPVTLHAEGRNNDRYLVRARVAFHGAAAYRLDLWPRRRSHRARSDSERGPGAARTVRSGLGSYGGGARRARRHGGERSSTSSAP